MSQEKITARFKVPDGQRWIPVDVTIVDVDFAPPPRIIDVTVKVAGREQKLTYLDESRRRGKPDIESSGGKFLGPVLRQNVVMPDEEPIVVSLGGRANGIVDGLYPFSDDYEVYGVWGLLNLLSGGLA